MFRPHALPRNSQQQKQKTVELLRRVGGFLQSKRLFFFFVSINLNYQQPHMLTRCKKLSATDAKPGIWVV